MPKTRSPAVKKAMGRSGSPAQPQADPPRVQDRIVTVGIGASAGGLDACRKFLDALPADTGMAFILIQHLDPNHESLLVNLLATHTRMPVHQAMEGMRIERDRLYVIPPGTYLSVGNGILHLTRPEARHGARLPFDFLLRSLAEEYGNHGVGVVLSGTGADGSLGLAALKDKRGYVIAQDPSEAGYDGMPRSAIQTILVDEILPLTRIPDALIQYGRRLSSSAGSIRPPAAEAARDWLTEIVDLLRIKTAHDFTHYKQGTLRRRIARRMALANISPDDMEGYLKVLRSDQKEMDLLTADLLINVTSFFRDPAVFDALAERAIPDLSRDQPADHPIRIWIAGCSTGEEAYSLAMVFQEQLSAIRRDVKFQIFASDVDPDAVAAAREGIYRKTIEADVTPARLARFFVKEGSGYRVSAELRAAVVFTVHDVLADPPFSRLDLISCRNLLIYLSPEAQEKVLSVFHFALREGGVLVLGSSENIAEGDHRFPTLAKRERIYRHIGHGRPAELRLAMHDRKDERNQAGTWQDRAPSRQTTLAELCRRLVLEAYAPGAVLINRKYECLYSLGPVDRYLGVAAGYPSADLLVIAREGVRTRLRSAIQRASRENTRVVVAGGQESKHDDTAPFHISVQPIVSDGEELFLICFIDAPQKAPKRGGAITPQEATQMAQLRKELHATRLDLQGATRDLEFANEEQRAINEESASVNEEYQSANEELLTSKEELQSLNEELVTLNHQLQETLGRERVVFDDLQNVLHCTDVATLFLDTDLNIRLFTPATKFLFGILPDDVGRPLSDLKSYADDSSLLAEARTVLQTAAPLEREIEADNNTWFRRCILPYRSQEDKVEGVVITFANITDQRRISDALDAARRQAEQANLVKSRFLAVASHDLRQPLQTLTLLQGLLARQVSGAKAESLVKRFEEALDAMSGILNTLLDINRIEAGTVRAEMEDFPIDDILQRLTSELSYHAQAKGLDLRQVPCGLRVHSDPRLLEQILRNFLSNAVKYTNSGRILIGCRRRKDELSIEIWDTGIGIPGPELQAVFDEYHQLENPARERSRGLGLGLSIVRQLGRLLGHRVSVRSQPGRGSVFSIEIALASAAVGASSESHTHKTSNAPPKAERKARKLLVIEDDPGVRELLTLLLEDEGHAVAVAADGPTALALAAGGMRRPDLILADYNLPGGMNGLQLTAKLRETLHAQVPAIILTGDISTGLLRDIGGHDCVHLNKPVKLLDLVEVIRHLLPETGSISPVREPFAGGSKCDQDQPVIYVVDDDEQILDAIRIVLEADSRAVELFRSSEAFLDAYVPGREGCLLVDAYLPGMDGFALLQKLNKAGNRLPAIMITGYGDVSMAVHAMKAGAIDFIEKPVGHIELLASVQRALEMARDAGKKTAWLDAATAQVASLTPRQHEIMQRVLAGEPSKNIAADLGISQRTVENHRAAIMKRTNSKSLPALARLALAADGKVVATTDPQAGQRTT